jgi:hypothetical protein
VISDRSAFAVLTDTRFTLGLFFAFLWLARKISVDLKLFFVDSAVLGSGKNFISLEISFESRD